MPVNLRVHFCFLPHSRLHYAGLMTLSPQPIVSPETAEVVFEDDEIVVLNKHSGLLVLPYRYDRSIPNLYGLLKKKYGQIYVVHRIDKETSGLIVFAKTEESHRSLNAQFEVRTTHKEYQAICPGESQNDHGRIELPLS